MSDIRTFAFSKTRQSGNFPIFGEYVKDNSSSLFKSESFVVITQKSIDFYKIKQCQLKESFPLSSVTAIKYSHPSISITFNNKKKIEIETNKQTNANSSQTNVSSLVFGAIIHVIQHLLTRDEISQLNLKGYNISPLIYYGDGPLFRISEQYKIENSSLMNDNIPILTKIIQHRERKIDFSLFKNPTTIVSYVLDSLQMLPFVEEIEIPLLHIPDVYGFLISYLGKMTNIKYLKITGKCNSDSFSKFLNKIETSNYLHLISLYFVDSFFKEQDYRAISEFLDNKKLTSIGFQNSSSQSSSNYFLSSNFFHQSMFQSITLLNLDNTPNIDLSKILPYVQNLLSLSVANCNLQLSNIFFLLQKIQLTKLRELNASNNICFSLPEEVDFPRYITRFIADDVQWGTNTLAICLYLCLERSIPNISLSFNNAKMNLNEWSNVFKVFWQSKFAGVYEFSWNNNPISPMILGFLSRQNQLYALSIDGTMRDSAPEIFQYFITFCAETTIRKLSLKGERGNRIGRMFGSIAKGIISAKYLEELDVSNNKIGDGGLDLIKQALSKSRTIKIINFDGAKPLSANTFYQAYQSNSDIKMNYPEDDIQLLLDKKQISVEQVDFIKEKCSEVVKNPIPTQTETNTQIFIPRDSIYNQNPMNFNKVEINPMYPLYHTPLQISQLQNGVAPLPRSIAQRPVQYQQSEIRQQPQQIPQQSLQQQSYQRRVFPQNAQTVPQRSQNRVNPQQYQQRQQIQQQQTSFRQMSQPRMNPQQYQERQQYQPQRQDLVRSQPFKMNEQQNQRISSRREPNIQFETQKNSPHSSQSSRHRHHQREEPQPIQSPLEQIRQRDSPSFSRQQKHVNRQQLEEPPRSIQAQQQQNIRRHHNRPQNDTVSNQTQRSSTSRSQTQNWNQAGVNQRTQPQVSSRETSTRNQRRPAPVDTTRKDQYPSPRRNEYYEEALIIDDAGRISPVHKRERMRYRRPPVVEQKSSESKSVVSPRRAQSIKSKRSPTGDQSPKRRRYYHSDDDEIDDYNTVSLDMSDEHPSPKPSRPKRSPINDDYDDTRTFDAQF